MELLQGLQPKGQMKSIYVYEEMKKELLSGEWKFGEKILVNKLIEKYDVSRRPVMDGLKMLENDGFIEIIPQSGCKVVNYSKKNILDQLLLSSYIESLCTELAALNHSSEEIEYVENYISLRKNNPDQLKDKLNYLKFTREVHFSFFLMTHSEIIKSQTLKIWNLTDFYMLKSFDYYMNDPLLSIDSHMEIVDCIKQRDAQKASEKMRRYTLNTINKLVERLP